MRALEADTHVLLAQLHLHSPLGIARVVDFPSSMVGHMAVLTFVGVLRSRRLLSNMCVMFNVSSACHVRRNWSSAEARAKPRAEARVKPRFIVFLASARSGGATRRRIGFSGLGWGGLFVQGRRRAVQSRFIMDVLQSMHEQARPRTRIVWHHSIANTHTEAGSCNAQLQQLSPLCHVFSSEASCPRQCVAAEARAKATGDKVVARIANVVSGCLPPDRRHCWIS